MKDRRGFALVAVLWVIVALAGMTAAAVSHARVGAANASARIISARGRWAAEACLAASLAELNQRAARGVPFVMLDTDSLDLADGTRCTVTAEDSTASAPFPGSTGPSSVHRLVLTAVGRVPGQPQAARIDLVVVSAGVRAAITGRRVW